MKKLKFLSILCLVSFFMILSALVETTVEDIVKHPGEYLSKHVKVNGTCTQAVEDDNGNYYILQGKFGSVITVNCIDLPENFKKYTVEGLVQKDKVRNRPIIVETSRFDEEPPDFNDIDGDGIPNDWETRHGLNPNDPDDAFIDNDNDGTSNYAEYFNGTDPNKSDKALEWWYILIIVVVIAIIFILVFLFKSKSSKKMKEDEVVTGGDFNTDSSQPKEQINDSFTTRQDLKTIKINLPNDPKTMKFIPGKFEIISPEDNGKIFQISGFPTEEGGIVTIGRKNVSGERSISHIKLDDSMYPTVSREQAEIIHNNNNLFIRNKSKVNLTRVNDKELQVDERVKIKYGDVLTMGALQIKYKK